MRDWDFKGVFKNGVDSISSFFGRRGVIPGGYSPFPSGTISATATEVTAPGSTDLQVHAVNTYGYQWEKSRDGVNWEVMVDETSKSMTQFYPYLAGIAGEHHYRCICKGYVGHSTTPEKIITVSYHAPSVTVAASKESIIAPGSVIFTATAEYAESCRWQVDSGDGWEDIEGITDAELTAAFAYGEGGLYFYRCIVTGLGGSAESPRVAIWVAEHEPVVTVSADRTEIIQGETVTLSAAARFTESYEWQREINGVWMQYATDPEITFDLLDIGYHKFRCICIGLGGSTTSDELSIHVSPAVPVISITADKTEVLTGEEAVITSAYFPASTNLQWQICDSGTWTDLITHERSLSVEFPDAGEYLFRCIADNYGSQTTSNIITITVSEPELEEGE